MARGLDPSPGMINIGYCLSSEEHRPNDLVAYAQRAEEAGFTFAMISDHFHPWSDRQGQSPFVWSTLGGIAQATHRLEVGTGVTCPIMRIHPAIIAQAAATTAAMMPDRFFLGVGTGEALNEHILGDPWPSVDTRLDMLEEAVEVIRLLWQGGVQSHIGPHFVVENARVYTLPETVPRIVMAASGPESAEVAGRIADGLVSTAPEREIVETFEQAGGTGKPRYAQATVCWARDETEARRIAHTWWPTAALRGSFKNELPLPMHLEEASSLVTEDAVAQAIVCGPDPERHLEQIRKFAAAGFDHVYIHQVGPDQEGFFRFYAAEVLPRVAREQMRAA